MIFIREREAEVSEDSESGPTFAHVTENKSGDAFGCSHLSEILPFWFIGRFDDVTDLARNRSSGAYLTA